MGEVLKLAKDAMDKGEKSGAVMLKMASDVGETSSGGKNLILASMRLPPENQPSENLVLAQQRTENVPEVPQENIPSENLPPENVPEAPKESPPPENASPENVLPVKLVSSVLGTAPTSSENLRSENLRVAETVSAENVRLENIQLAKEQKVE